MGVEMTKKLTAENVLKKPLQPDEIEWRIQSAKNSKTTVVPYISNRCVMNRFDEAFGIDGWYNTFAKWGHKGVKCGLSVFTVKGWVTKYDGADETAIESTKGGFSDSMKRAAVQWGIGRELYTYPRVMFGRETKFLSDDDKDRLGKLVKAFHEGKLDKPVYIL